MSYGFSIVVDGTKEAQMTFEGVAAQAANARPAFEEIYLTILDIEQEAFDKEGARSGFPKWADLLLSTVLDKARRGMNPQILRATDDLMNALTTYRSKDIYTRIESDKIVFAPMKTGKVRYGLWHQTGYAVEEHGFGGLTMGRVPARPIVRFSKSDAAAFGREISRHLMRHSGPGKISVSFDG